MPPGDPNEAPKAAPALAPTVVAGAPGAAPEDTAEPVALPDQMLGHYRLVKELGRGGMGAVFAALDTRLDRRVAVKIMLPRFAADAAAKARFLREARVAGQISHDNVVTIFEADECDGVPFIAMQFLQGYSLEGYLAQRGELSVAQSIRIGAEAAAGLSAAHALGLVHRDVKPANLWLEAPSGRVKVLDFGLAKPADTDRELTRSGMVVGTPTYMSPEQARGQKVDGRSDLFSLGVLLYRLLSGRLPFDGPTTMAVLTALAADDPAPVRALNPHVPEVVAALVHQLITKNPEGRPQTAAEVSRRLRDVLVSAASAGPTGEPPAADKPAPVVIAVGAAPRGNPFAELDDTATEVTTPAPTRAALLHTDGGRGWAWALAAAAFAGVVVVGAAVALRTRDRAEPPPPPPAPEPIARPKDPKPAPPKPAPDPDRAAAEWVLAAGGTVRVNGTGIDFRTNADLPREPFRLTRANLDGRPVAADGLARLVALGDVAELLLKNTTVTDAELAVLKDARLLHTLELDGTKVTDAGLAHLAGLTKLAVVSLKGTAVTDAGLASLKGLPALTELHLSRTAVGDAGVAHLAALDRLKVLDLSETTATDAGLAHLRGATGLRHLELSGTGVTDAGLKDLAANLHWLSVLKLGGTRVTAAGTAAYHEAAPRCWVEADTGNLEPLDVQRAAAEWVLSVGGKVSTRDDKLVIKPGDQLPKEPFALHTIDLTNVPVTDVDLQNLKHLYDIKRLFLYRTRVTDTGLIVVGRLNGLTDLWLTGTRVSDPGLAHLHRLTRLEHLSLSHTNVTDAGLAHVAKLKGLKKLGVDYLDGIVGTGLGALAALPVLEELWLQGDPRLRDDALGNLAGCKSLRLLVLQGCPTTDAGLRGLERCTQLTTLNVHETRVTAAGVARFRAAVPTCAAHSSPKK